MLVTLRLKQKIEVKNIKNKGGSGGLIVLILLIVAILFLAISYGPTQPERITTYCGDGICQSPGETQTSCPTDCGVVGGRCDADVSPDITVSAYDIDNVGTALTESNNIYRKVGDVSWTSWTQGTEITDLTFGDTYEFVTGISSSDFTDNAYGPHFFWTVPCSPDTSMQVALYDDDVETDLTCTFYNADDNAATEAFSAGVVQTVSLKVSSGTEDYFGNPYLAEDLTMSDKQNGKHRKKYPNCLNLNLNSTGWDKPEKVYFVRLDGTGDELNRISCPGIADTSSGNISYCYECPIITDTITRIYIKMDPDDTNAPTVDNKAYIHAGGYFVDDDGNLDWGCETDLLAYVGTDDADECVLDVSG